MFFICFMANKDEYILQQPDNLSNKTNEIRKEKGPTNYEQFAFENEIPRAQYGRYEKGHDLRFSSLLKILKAMDISLKDFFNAGFEE